MITQTHEQLINRFRGCLLGLASGDAVGTTVEFCPRGTFPPVTDMTGGGPFDLNAGEWTDDTSMALCLATSLIEMGQFDPEDQMRRYCQWKDAGYLSSNGCCFDIGNATHRALRHFQQTGDPFSGSTDKDSAGNGCLMRLAPIPLFFFANPSELMFFAGESARTTHGAAECIAASQLFGAQLFMALSGGDKEQILWAHEFSDLSSLSISAIAKGNYKTKSIDNIRGSGYVVESLEAALWCFLNTDSFEEAILQATNLGDDTDTTAAICGQLAGAYYGETGIPTHWLERLVMRKEIGVLAEQLYFGNRLAK
jgi:ADP-ribosyl-[dinitrogen reductase] hydrolase